MRWLDEAISSYIKEDVYPFHMPGAKRQNPGLKGDPFLYDITEIDEFDDLRNPDGLLAVLEREWAKMYGAKEALLSVNGSTGGNLSCIFAAADEGETVLVAEGAHWSVYNAAKLHHLRIVDIPVEKGEEGFFQAVSPEAVEEALKMHEKVRAVIITTPTYEGMVSEVSEIADIIHRRDVSLIVDGAHGAHFGLAKNQKKDGYENPIHLGADVVVVSLHKTLPVFGQTSLILFGNTDKENPRVSVAAVKHYLNMFQTSSPSYLLMSGAAAGCRFLQENGETLWPELIQNLEEFYRETESLHFFQVVKNKNHDRSKIIVSTKNAGISGHELMKRLRKEYSLELERSGSYYALALCSIMDRREGFQRLARALQKLEKEIGGG
ncbi:MAG: aminotransferase class V-fold PLP-dependent enzyme [Lachnospiraceae bacterium]|nr:aminotransferase class V-fold PLP-dependent enzyme [Lachnospiraceae bacterium]